VVMVLVLVVVAKAVIVAITNKKDKGC